MKHWRWFFAAAALAAASACAGQTSRPRLTDEQLKGLYDSAPLVVQIEIESVQGTMVHPRLTYEAAGRVVEALKGTLAPGKISVHVESPIRAFDLPASDLAGRQYVAAVAPLKGAGDRHFELVGGAAFAADGPEAEALRKMAGTSASPAPPPPVQQLTLRVEPKQPVFLPEGPKVVEVRLTNSGPESAAYVNAPVIERDGKLYLPGAGALWIRDAAGRLAQDKGNVQVGASPPPPAKPALILPGASFTETIDLAKFYALPPGRYTLFMALEAPDGRGRVPSNGLSIQIGAVNLPEPPPPVSPLTPAGEAVSAAKLPASDQYKPGQPRAGLAALLRPLKTTYEVGEPVELEFRLINTSPRSMAVDVRMERTLTFEATPVGDSPPPRSLRNTILWPLDGPGLPEARAYLGQDAFWGRVININWYYDKQEQDLPRRQEIEGGKNFAYERFGQMLFDFQKAGVYRIRATYRVSRPTPPKPAEGEAVAAPDLDWWVGDLDSNPVLIRIVEPRRFGR